MTATRERTETFEVFDDHLVRKVVPVRGKPYEHRCPRASFEQIAHAAEGFGLDAEIHGPGPAHRHLMAAIRNTNYFELGLVHPKAPAHSGKIYADYSDNLDDIDENGCVYVPKGPGLGVTIDWDYVNASRTGGRVWG